MDGSSAIIHVTDGEQQGFEFESGGWEGFMSKGSHPFGAPASAWRPSPLWSSDASGWDEEVAYEMAWGSSAIMQREG